MAIDVTIQRTHSAYCRMIVLRGRGKNDFGLGVIGTALAVLAER